MTICHAEAQLLKRNELLEELWAIDHTLREMHAGPWETDPMLSADIRDLADCREDLAREITLMGAIPWCFNITHDNSFLVQARKELADQGTGHGTIEA